MAKTIHTERHRKLRALLIAKRRAAGLTQTVVAERLGKPPSYVAKYEGGDRRLDVLEYLDVAAAIGFDPCEALQTLKREHQRVRLFAHMAEARALSPEGLAPAVVEAVGSMLRISPRAAPALRT